MSSWTKEQRAAYMRKYRAEHPNYAREWHARNAAHVNKRQRKKYRDDEAYRELMKIKARKWQEERRRKDGSK